MDPHGICADVDDAAFLDNVVAFLSGLFRRVYCPLCTNVVWYLDTLHQDSEMLLEGKVGCTCTEL